MRASRKRRRADGRLASPPLAPSPLTQRNLQLLPVGLTQLPNDAEFVRRLEVDVDDLLSTFAQVCLLTLVQNSHTNAQSEARVSPFAIFTQLYVERGWHLAQFAFGDHHDSKRNFGHSVCRVLLQRLRHEQAVQIEFADLKELFLTVGIPFALFTFWETQLCPDSGIGVKPHRRDLSTIPIEQDVYDRILDLPHAVLEYLEVEPMSRQHAHAIVSDLTEVLCRMCGHPASTPAASKAKQKQDPSTDELAPVFDIIPATGMSTRRPRIWPSVQIMSTREADKRFNRVAKIVRVQDPDSGSSIDGAGPSNRDTPRESVIGLSRGDLIRIRARQRLDWALADLPELHPEPSSPAPSTTVIESSHQVQPHPRSLNGAMRPHYEVEMSPWMAKAKYTAKLKPWLDVTSKPLENALDRLSQSRLAYDEARSNIMSNLNEPTRQAEARPDFSSNLLEEFVTRFSGEEVNGSSLPAVTEPLAENPEESERSSHHQLYLAAALQTRQAIMAISDEIHARMNNGP